MSLSIDKMCRTCLSMNQAMLSLFDNVQINQNASSSVADKLKSFTSVDISDGDGLPSKVCLSCISEINRAYSFKIKCESSETSLKQFAQQLGIKCSSPDVVNIKKQDSPKEEEVIKTYEEDIGMYAIENVKEALRASIEERDADTQKIDFTPDYGDITSDNEVFIVQEEEDNKNEETTDESHVLVYACIACCETFDKSEDFQEHSKNCCGSKDDLSSNEVEDLPVNNTEDLKPADSKQKSIKKEPIKCPHCPIDFVHRKNLEKHILKYHLVFSDNSGNLNSDKTVTEEVNNKDADANNDNESIVDIEELKYKPIELSHSQSHCTKCGAGFAKERSLVYHIKQNKCTEKQFECKTCKRVFISKENLIKHIKSHKESQKVECTKCPKIFTSQEKLNTHTEREHKRLLKNQCPHCKKVFNMLSTLKDHVRTHSGEKPFLCSICGKGFSQSTNLKQHTMRHTNTKPYKCNQCDYSFVSKGELNAHNRKHTGDHPFVCDLCGSGFTTSSSLLKHKRIHTGERPYACEFCPMRFTALGTLKNHRRTHTGEKPFICRYCERAFAQKSDCVSHMRTHTGERPYICPICGFSFQQSGTMKTHLRTHKRGNSSKTSSGKKIVEDAENYSFIEKKEMDQSEISDQLYDTPDELKGEILQS